MSLRSEPSDASRLTAANVNAFRSAYAVAFRAYVGDRSETALRAAYELGRDAVSKQVGLLELAQSHHAVLLAVLEQADGEEASEVTSAGADFLLEALSAYEMVRRAVADAQATVASERRHASMIRRLSTLLADASLALHGRSSIEELLQLVVEQACELTSAAWAVAHAYCGAVAPTAVLACAGDAPPDASAVVEESYSAFGTRVESTDVARLDVRSCEGEVLALPLVALDGRTSGFLAVAATKGNSFGDLDHAVLVHIAEMTGAALERAQSYQAGTVSTR